MANRAVGRKERVITVADVETFTDSSGISWNVFPAEIPGQPVWEASLQLPAYKTQPGERVIAAKSRAQLEAFIEAYVTEFISEPSKKPRARGGDLVVTAPRPDPTPLPRPTPTGSSGGLFFLLLIGLAIFGDRKKRRGR